MGIARLRSGASRLVEDRVMTIFSKWVERVDAGPGEPVDVYLGSHCVATAFYEGVGAVGRRVLGWECGLDVEETLRSRVGEAYAARRAL
ncbi:MAG: hypothetical protein QI199_04365, partial [Candidatus Korarchaeota archaeon]|nr:hypothetical protein [Candidatus Korarchaeota archaeon]